jgi:hypothetical protein
LYCTGESCCLFLGREKGEVLDRGLIENIEELFGVGPNHSESKARFTIDEELPNMLENTEKKSFDVEYGVSSEVMNMVAKNLEGLEQGLAMEKIADTGGTEPEVPVPQPRVCEGNRAVRIKTITDVDPGAGPPPGAVAKIVIVANRRLNQTRIVFATVEGREQHSFSINTADIRQGFISCIN